MSIFVASFIVLSVGCFLVYLLSKHTAHGEPSSEAFRRFQRIYLTVYLTAQGADWLQGPHVYALFSSYGLTPKQINQLFVVGFGSSMIFGTVVGSFADRVGRKFNCVLYGILYGADCLAKQFPNYWVLICGRLMGGVATSILFSAFESWLLCEHQKRGFSKDSLSDLFSNAVLGNSLVAILAGLVAQAVAIQYGFAAPFMLSLLLLIMVSVIICLSWTENYGDTSGSFKSSLFQGIQVIRKDPKVFCLGLTQSLFEGSMYSFVLEWTPALTPASQIGIERVEGNIPHGWIFATFMVAVMIGSRVFRLLSKLDTVESFMRPVFAIAALSLATPIILPQNQTAVFIGFIVFECCVGIFWPALGVLRGKYVPEETRATVMNIFRIPLNMIVIAILVQDLAQSTVFCCCVVFLIFCCAIQQHLCYLSQDHSNHSEKVLEGEPAMESGQNTAGSV